MTSFSNVNERDYEKIYIGNEGVKNFNNKRIIMNHYEVVD